MHGNAGKGEQMEPQEHVAGLKAEIEHELSSFFEAKTGSIQDGTVRTIAELVRDYTLRGGKRIRPILLVLGHDLFEGHDENVVKASISIEISQSYFLIQDDIMDQSPMRRGMPSFHVELYDKFFSGEKDGKRLAESIGVIASDLAESYCHQVLFESGISDKQANIGDSELSSIFEVTGNGQLIDVFSPFQKEFKTNDLIRLHLWKTARYTVQGPLVMGARMSLREKNLDQLSYFGNLAGVAFQIYDDVLGLFGEQGEIGKSIKSYVNEGKRTLLMLKAIENSSESDARFISDCLRSGNVSDDEFNRLKHIVESSGSLDYSTNLVEKLNRRAKEYLSEVDGNPEIKKILSWVSDFIIRRKN